MASAEPHTRGRGRVALIEAGSPGLNIYSHVAMGRGIPLLATVLRNEGFETRAFVEDISGKDSIDWEYVRGADAVGFSAITCTLPRTAQLIERTRAENPSASIILGGPEPTCDHDRSLAIGADYVLAGETELTLPALLSALLEGVGCSDEIPGIIWRDDDGAIHEGPPPVQLTRVQLDALPLVDRSLIHDVGKCSVASVWRARGCPSRCDFCEVCQIWPRYVARDPDQAVSELLAAQHDGFSTAFLIDDNAAANKGAFKDLLRTASERGFVQTLVTQIRADSVFTKDGRLDKELLKLLKKAAAVTVVCIGVESADHADLERMHKGIDSSRTAKALKAMRRRGILVHGMFIALAEDTREVVRRNGDYARKYVTSLQYLFETPLPGTVRTRLHEKAGALLFERLEDLSLYDGMHVVVRPAKMTSREMVDLVGREYRRFYSLRRIVFEALRGTFARFRLLSDAQRKHLRTLGVRGRIKAWAWFHIEYKYAPTAFLAIGRARVRAFMRDPDYAAYIERLGA